jgi:hypothetical protein
MASGQYLVYPASGHFWGIQFEGQFLARFSEKTQAIRAAMTLASSSANAGADNTVLVEGPDGERYPIWSQGRDSLVSAA